MISKDGKWKSKAQADACWPASCLNKERLVFGCMCSPDAADVSGLGVDAVVAPQHATERSGLEAQLGGVQLRELARAERPAVMRAGKGHVALLWRQLQLLIFSVLKGLLCRPAVWWLPQ